MLDAPPPADPLVASTQLTDLRLGPVYIVICSNDTLREKTSPLSAKCDFALLFYQFLPSTLEAQAYIYAGCAHAVV